MRFYTQQHRFYCGVDLHARTTYLCILDDAGQVVYDKTLAAGPDAFLQAVAPFRDGLVVAVECLFCWYWLADLCLIGPRPEPAEIRDATCGLFAARLPARRVAAERGPSAEVSPSLCLAGRAERTRF
jgi:hypothetical protein